MPENGKWQIAFWLTTVLLVGSFTWTTMCAYSADIKIEKLHDKYIDTMHSIDLRLSRIEYRLGVDNDSGVRVQ